jgi:alkylation response protein AidB-like acyl-CoA dehydrogenase
MTQTIEMNPITSTSTDWTAVAREIGEQIQSGVAERDRTGQISQEVFDLLRRRGVLTALAPLDRGGAGASHQEWGAFLRELALYDAPTALTTSMHSHIVATQVFRHRHGMDADLFFTNLVENQPMLISTGASDWVSSSGSTERVDGGYRVCARKTPASGCEIGTALATSIRWESPEGPQVVHCSIPFSADGVGIEQTWDTLGMRATGSHTVVFDDVFVPNAAVSLVRPADVWHPIWNAVIGSALPLIMSVYVGIADAAVDATLATVSGRSDAHVLQLVGEMVNAHTTGADVVDAMLRSSDNLKYAPSNEHSGRTMARKTVASGALIETVRLGIEATGGFGFTKNSSLERLYRDVHGCLFHPLPRAKQTTLSGRVALGHEPIG